MSDVELINTFKKIIFDKSKSWVLFKNGTCVIIMQPQDNLKDQAIEILRKNSTIQSGSPFGDFSVTRLENDPGWAVGGNHPDILMYISEDEAGKNASNFEVGLLGRANREADGKQLKVIHVENNYK